MPARIQPTSNLKITFERRDGVVDTQFASTPQRALKAAVLMLAHLDELFDGDKLTVVVHKSVVPLTIIAMAIFAIVPAVI
jgi:hypothetical protein